MSDFHFQMIEKQIETVTTNLIEGKGKTAIL